MTSERLFEVVADLEAAIDEARAVLALAERMAEARCSQAERARFEATLAEAFAREVATKDPARAQTARRLASNGRLEKPAEALLAALAAEAGVDIAKRPPDWPATGRGLAARLTRLAPVLRQVAGLAIGRGSTGRDRTKQRTVVITRTLAHACARGSEQSSPPSPSSPAFDGIAQAVDTAGIFDPGSGDDCPARSSPDRPRTVPNRPHLEADHDERGRLPVERGRSGTIALAQSSPLQPIDGKGEIGPREGGGDGGDDGNGSFRTFSPAPLPGGRRFRARLT